MPNSALKSLISSSLQNTPSSDSRQRANLHGHLRLRSTSDNASSSTLVGAGRSTNDKRTDVPTITFLVDNTYFHVPYRCLQTASESVFADMFLLPSGESSPEGSRENPVLLPPTISAEDFTYFLECLCPESISSPRLHPVSQGWIPVLALSTQWHFPQIREKAIHALSQQGMRPLDRIRLGRLYVVSSWLISAYQELSTSDELLTEEEELTLGEWAASNIRSTRLARRTAGETGAKFDVCKKVKEVFEDELMDDETYREAVRIEKSLETKPLCWPWTMMRGIGA